MMDPARFLARGDKILPGTVEVITVPNPAAAADWTVTVAAGAQWRVQAIRAKFTSSATAGSRFPGVSYTVAGVKVYRTADPVAIPISIAANYNWSVGDGYATSAVNNANSTVPLLGMWLPDGSVIAGDGNATLAGDTWTGISLIVEKCLYNNTTLTQFQDQVYETEYPPDDNLAGVKDFLATTRA